MIDRNLSEDPRFEAAPQRSEDAGFVLHALFTLGADRKFIGAGTYIGDIKHEGKAHVEPVFEVHGEGPDQKPLVFQFAASECDYGLLTDDMVPGVFDGATISPAEFAESLRGQSTEKSIDQNSATVS